MPKGSFQKRFSGFFSIKETKSPFKRLLLAAGGVNRLFDLRRCYMNRGRFRGLRSPFEIQAKVVRLREGLPGVT